MSNDTATEDRHPLSIEHLDNARRDDWHKSIVGSDIRAMLAELDRLHQENRELRKPKYGHPQQPTYVDDHGTVRFKENKLIRYLLDQASIAGIDMNHLAVAAVSLDLPIEDQRQFAQLIGYSVGGFFELSYVTGDWEAEEGDGYYEWLSEQLDKHGEYPLQG